jgi:hypothetical protein
MSVVETNDGRNHKNESKRFEKGILATFEMIYFIAWSPDTSQPKPAKRGFGTVSMKDLAKDFDTTLNIIKDE